MQDSVNRLIGSGSVTLEKLISIQTRKVDSIGRVSVPAHARRVIGVDVGDNVRVLCYPDHVEIWPVADKVDRPDRAGR